uniref:helix-turn-helix domain-containing protein n=1 Tax=uncultured Sphingomonas sp. TaxID=158754 RepID=UPI0025D24460|nr:AraC family transcriptional regulator [uncultured Sphingomonas sp.]
MAATTPLISPAALASDLSAPPVLSSETSGWKGAEVRLWQGIDPHSYPPLDHHCLTLHLGDPRRIIRRGEGGELQADIRPGAVSFTPIGAVYEWETTGPVDYAELYLSAEFIRKINAEVFDRDSTGLALEDRLGVQEPLIEATFNGLIEEMSEMKPDSRLYLDSLLLTLSVRLVRLCGSVPDEFGQRRPTLAPARLRRVLEYIETNLSLDIGVADLAAVARMSPFHFSRAFTLATGGSPYSHLIKRRLARAKTLLGEADTDIPAIALECGFRTEGQFCRMFKRSVGTTPRRYRREA